MKLPRRYTCPGCHRRRWRHWGHSACCSFWCLRVALIEAEHDYRPVSFDPPDVSGRLSELRPNEQVMKP